MLQTLGVFAVLSEMGQAVQAWWHGTGWVFGLGWKPSMRVATRRVDDASRAEDNEEKAFLAWKSAAEEAARARARVTN
jgi:hypothetical protein